MAEDLTYQEERRLTFALQRVFADLTSEELALLDRAWLRMSGVKFAVHVHHAARDVAGKRVQAEPAKPLDVDTLARQPCTICGKPIGFGVGFYGTDQAPCHSDCAERDAHRGMTWWNGLSIPARELALQQAQDELGRSPSAADCWRLHLRASVPQPCEVA